jgi:hypothetical protein
VIKEFQENRVIKVKEVRGDLQELLAKKVKKAALVKKVIKETKAKKATKVIKDFLERWETRDPEAIKVYEVNRAKEVKKVIWDIEDHLEIKVLLENLEVKENPVKLDCQVTKEIKAIKARLDQLVTREIKERWECKEKPENQVMQVCLEKLEKEDQPVYLEKEDYQVIKEYVETKEIKAKEVNKEREVCKENRVSAVIVENRAKKEP